MDFKLSKAEEKQLEEKIQLTDHSSVLTLLDAKNNAANRVSCTISKIKKKLLSS
jgi:hypothetical protein